MKKNFIFNIEQRNFLRWGTVVQGVSIRLLAQRRRVRILGMASLYSFDVQAKQREEGQKLDPFALIRLIKHMYSLRKSCRNEEEKKFSDKTKT